MQIVFAAILLLGHQGVLESYHLTIDPILLDSLYAHPFDDLEFPAMLWTEAGSSSCMAGFRGGTSLWCSKKSWRFELADPSLLGFSHLLLDAHYRDLSLMRNALAMWLARRLGRPAPETEHVELIVNGEPYGVYVRVERIDEFFFERNGIGEGPLFKSVSHEARFAWQPCDTTLITGFEAKEGSDEDFDLVRRLTDQVNLGLPFEANVPDWIAYAAVTLAIYDTDALSKNYYVHRTPQGEWRFYPWDRDASFGNTWTGVYDSSWVRKTTTFSFSITPMTARLLMEEENREMLGEYILELSEIMLLELPGIIDSIRAEIRDGVEADPFYDGSVQDFDEAVALLRSAVIERAGILPGITEGHHPLEPVSVTLSQWDLPVGSPQPVTITATYPQPVSDITLAYCVNDGNPIYTWMEPVGGDPTIWTRTVQMTVAAQHVQFAVRTGANEGGGCNSVFSWPLYGLPTSISRRIAAPTVRRSAWPFQAERLRLHDPVRLTPFLWELPLVNEGPDPVDLSYFGFQAGAPPARAWSGEGLVLDPGDTLLLTNSHALLRLIRPGRRMVGDLVLDSPSSTPFLLIAPSWDTLFTETIGPETPGGGSSCAVLLSEVCFDGGQVPGDWIELYNPGPTPADLSGWLLLDLQDNHSVLPEGTSIEPGGFLVVCADIAAFREVYGIAPVPVEALGFGLNPENDGVSLFHGDQLCFSVVWNPSWQLLEDHVLSLLAPALPGADPGSWQAVAMPGTPGRANPGWPPSLLRPLIASLRPNPSAGAFTIDYTVPYLPADLLVYDLAGRLVQPPAEVSAYSGSLSVELPSGIPPGVYFAVLRSTGVTSSASFVVLRRVP